MLRDEIEKVLESFYGQYKNGILDATCYDVIKETSTHILELFKKCVPEEKAALSITSIDDPNLLIDQNYYNGYNQALAEIKGRIG